MEVFVLSTITRFAVRSSGRDLTAVRRPSPSLASVTLVGLKKAELVATAQERGVDTSGTKAEIIDRLTGVESNDATVETDG